MRRNGAPRKGTRGQRQFNCRRSDFRLGGRSFGSSPTRRPSALAICRLKRAPPSASAVRRGTRRVGEIRIACEIARGTPSDSRPDWRQAGRRAHDRSEANQSHPAHVHCRSTRHHSGDTRHAGTHRIKLDGATAREKAGFAVNRRRAIAPFPHYPGWSIPRISVADGAAAKRLRGAWQAPGAARRHQQVYGVGRQAEETRFKPWQGCLTE
jgi:hypothetical protein